jgi:hypothetical protein
MSHLSRPLILSLISLLFLRHSVWEQNLTSWFKSSTPTVLQRQKIIRRLIVVKPLQSQMGQDHDLMQTVMGPRRQFEKLSMQLMELHEVENSE